MLTVTALYTAILALMMVFLAYKTSSRRREKKISLNYGADKVMELRSRAFGNFSEFVPMMILLLAVTEMQGQEDIYLHIMGIATVVARLLHALGLTGVLKIINGRFAGAVLTYIILLVGGGCLLYNSLTQMM